MTTQAPNWETSKENVQPLREGRSVDKLDKTLATNKATIEEQRRQYLCTIKAMNHQNDDGDNNKNGVDPINVHVEYVKWAIESYPSGSNVISEAIETACRKFAKVQRYRNDIRLTRLWVRYADMRPDKEAVFEYMRKHKIGETLALFYEAWAHTMELKKQFEKCEDIYRMGRENRASPTERLAKRQSEFSRRMFARRKRDDRKKKDKQLKKFCNTVGNEHKSTNDVHQDQLRSNAIHSVLVDNDHEEQHQLQNGFDENGQPLQKIKKFNHVRPVLGAINDTEASTGLRPQVKTKQNKALATSTTVPSFQISNDSKSSASNNNNNSNIPSEKIEIFVDKNNNSKKGLRTFDDGGDDDMPERMIPKRDSLTKEDENPATKWAGETYRQNKSLASKFKSRTVALQTSFEVYDQRDYVDEEDDDESPNKKSKTCDDDDDDNAGIPSPTINTKLANAAVEAMLNGDPNGDENNNHDILNNVKLRQAETNINLPMKNVADIQRPPSPTINTKLAFQAVDGILNSTPPMERLGKRNRQRDVVKQSQQQQHHSTSDIVIFNDDDVLDNENNQEAQQVQNNPLQPLSTDPNNENMSNSQLQKSQPLTIFCDENEQDLEQQQQQAPAKGGENETNQQKLVDFMFEWTKDEPSFQLLSCADPENMEMMFDLECESDNNGQAVKLLSLYPQTLIHGHTKTSLIILAEDLNDIYKLSQANNDKNKEEDNDDDDDMSDDDEDDEDKLMVPVKVSTPQNIWEFYIYKTIEYRTKQQSIQSIPKALSFFEGQKYSYLITNKVSNGSLSDAMQLCSNNLLPESLSLFYIIDLLKTVEILHQHGIIHNDISCHNILTRESNNDDMVVSSMQYNRNGQNGWCNYGISLIDFNHSIDVQHERINYESNGDLIQHIQDIGEDFKDEEYKVLNNSNNRNKKWSFNIDCYSIAVVIAKLLGIEINENVQDNTKEFKHSNIWNLAISQLCNIQDDEHNKLNANTVKVMKHIRNEMEQALEKEHSLMRHVTLLNSKFSRQQVKRTEQGTLWK